MATLLSSFSRVLQPLYTRGVRVCALRWRIFEITSAEQFKKDVVNVQGPVIVDFHAELVYMAILYILKYIIEGILK